MNLIERAKNILLSPASEWDAINNEQPNVQGIITSYVFPLAGVAAIAAFIGYGIIGFNYGLVRFRGIDWGLYQAISIFAGALVSVFLSAGIIDALAPSFGAEKNFGRSIQLVAYSWTPAWVAGLLAILPSLAVISLLAGLYGLYLLYVGLPKLKKTPEEKHMPYFFVSLITIIIVFVIVGWIISTILMSVFGLSYGTLDFHI